MLVTTVPRKAPAGVTVVPVETAAQMEAAVLEHAPHADVVVMAAAVADFRPKAAAERKLAKADGLPELVLEPTPDILAELGRRRSPGQVLVGFAAETHDVARRAAAKLEGKSLDLVVANDVSARAWGSITTPTPSPSWAPAPAGARWRSPPSSRWPTQYWIASAVASEYANDHGATDGESDHLREDAGEFGVERWDGFPTEGSFAFTTPGLAPDAGTADVAVTFTPTDTNDYTTATATVVVVVNQALAAVTFGDLNQSYDRTAKLVSVTTSPVGLNVGVTQNGFSTVPTNAGNYVVVVTVNDPNYAGSATNTLVISQATAAVTLGDLNQSYDGTAKLGERDDLAGRVERGSDV